MTSCSLPSSVCALSMDAVARCWAALSAWSNTAGWRKQASIRRLPPASAAAFCFDADAGFHRCRPCARTQRGEAASFRAAPGPHTGSREHPFPCRGTGRFCAGRPWLAIPAHQAWPAIWRAPASALPEPWAKVSCRTQWRHRFAPAVGGIRMARSAAIATGAIL